MTGVWSVVTRPNRAPMSFLNRYQMVMEIMIQTKSKGKNSRGFGKNDLNMVCYISLPSVSWVQCCPIGTLQVICRFQLFVLKIKIRSSDLTWYIISDPSQQRLFADKVKKKIRIDYFSQQAVYL